MNSRVLVLVVMVCAAGIAACATTEVNAVWKDEAYQAQPKRVLVIAMFKDISIRRQVESEFKEHLKYRGGDAATGYEVFPGNELPTKDAVVQQVKAGGYDALLLTRLIDTHTERRTVPGSATYGSASHYGVPMGGYYGAGYTQAYTPSYQVDDRYATVESNLYDAATEKLVWTASSDTWLSGSNKGLIKTFVSIMVDSLRRNKIVP